MTAMVLRLPLLLDQYTGPQALPVPPEGIEPRRLIHTGVLRCIAQQRRAERMAAPHNDPAWQLTESRIDGIRRHHALTLRMVGRSLMQIHNRERFDANGEPLSTAIAEAVTLIPAPRILEGRGDDPKEVMLHLARAGYFPKTLNRDSLDKFLDRQYPEDSLMYLQAYPPARPPQAGEKTRNQLRAVFGVSRHTIETATDRLAVYPVIRKARTKGGSEYEYFGEPEQQLIESALQESVTQVPPLSSEEISVQTVGRKLKSVELTAIAIREGGISTFARRLPEQNKRATCMRIDEVPVVREVLHMLCSLRPGEKGYNEIARAIGISRSSLYDNMSRIRPDELAASRLLYGRYGKSPPIFPPDIAANIEKRFTLPPIPPYVISTPGIVRRLAPTTGAPGVRSALATALTPKLEMRLTSVVGGKLSYLYSWDDICRFEQKRYPSVNTTDPIDWGRLPSGPADIDPEKIAYAREIQARYVNPAHVDHMPIDQYILLQPPLYMLRAPKTKAQYRGGLTIEEIMDRTTAERAAIQQTIDAHTGRFTPPHPVMHNGTTIVPYIGEHLQTILIDLVGLSVTQMARRTGISESVINNYLNDRHYRTNEQGHYSKGVWADVEGHLVPPADLVPAHKFASPSISEKEIADLARKLGGDVSYYYVGDRRTPFLDPWAQALVRPQILEISPTGKPYADYGVAYNHWYNRFELAGFARCRPSEVDTWMQSALVHNGCFIWWRVRSPKPYARVLPHYDPDLSTAFLRHRQA